MHINIDQQSQLIYHSKTNETGNVLLIDIIPAFLPTQRIKLKVAQIKIMNVLTKMHIFGHFPIFGHSCPNMINFIIFAHFFAYLQLSGLFSQNLTSSSFVLFVNDILSLQQNTTLSETVLLYLICKLTKSVSLRVKRISLVENTTLSEQLALPYPIYPFYLLFYNLFVLIMRCIFFSVYEIIV